MNGRSFFVRSFPLFVLGVVAGGALGPRVASAGGWKRQHAALCHGVSNYLETDGITFGNPDSLTCPYDDDSNIPRTSITTLNVHGKATTYGSMFISACVKYWNASGFSGYGYGCGASSSPTGPGTFAISPSLYAWGLTAGDFAYIKFVPSGSPAGSIYGWFTAF